MFHRFLPTHPRGVTLGLIAVSSLAIGACSSGTPGGAADQMAETAENASEAPMGAGQAMKDFVSGTADLGTKAPEFVLTDTDGKSHKLSDFRGKVVVLEWFNPDCPFVKKHHVNNKSMAAAYGAVRGDDVVWLAINSGAPGKQGAGLERNRQARADYGIPYPVLLDTSGIVGRAYGAKNTPHMFVIDAEGKLAYVGAIDDNPSPDVIGQMNYVVETVGRLKKGESVSQSRTKPYGCSVKYAS